MKLRVQCREADKTAAKTTNPANKPDGVSLKNLAAMPAQTPTFTAPSILKDPMPAQAESASLLD